MVLLVITFIAIFVTWYFWPRYVDLELDTSVQNASISMNEDKNYFNSEYHWWFIDSNEAVDPKKLDMRVSPKISKEIFLNYPENIKDWGINFQELGIDFNNNNVILAFSREIKEMKFNRANWFPYHLTPTVKTIMSKDFDSNTIYVYKIPKYDVLEHPKAYSETYVEK